MPGHSSVLQVLGTFILWMGWYGFNPGSTLGIAPAGYAMHAARSVVTTTLAAAGGGVTVVALGRVTSGIWDVGLVCNGILAGLVSITAGCSTITCGLSLLTGVLGGGVYFGSSKLVVRALIDDPLDAFAVHGACGFWGVVAVGLFASPDYGYNAEGAAGLFYGGDLAGVLLGVQLAGLFAQIAWVSVMSLILFFALKAARILSPQEAAMLHVKEPCAQSESSGSETEPEEDTFSRPEPKQVIKLSAQACGCLLYTSPSPRDRG